MAKPVGSADKSDGQGGSGPGSRVASWPNADFVVPVAFLVVFEPHLWFVSPMRQLLSRAVTRFMKSCQVVGILLVL